MEGPDWSNATTMYTYLMTQHLNLRTSRTASSITGASWPFFDQFSTTTPRNERDCYRQVLQGVTAHLLDLLAFHSWRPYPETNSLSTGTAPDFESRYRFLFRARQTHDSISGKYSPRTKHSQPGCYPSLE